MSLPKFMRPLKTPPPSVGAARGEDRLVSVDAHRVAALADDELAAWATFLTDVQGRQKSRCPGR